MRQIISAIPYGQTKTYGQIATELGDPRRAYDVGQICAGNPLLLLIPCHRVLAADGSLRGYAGGLRRKEQLLSLEQGTPVQRQLAFSAAG